MNCHWTILATLRAMEKDDPFAYALERREEAAHRSGSEWSMWNAIVHAMRCRESDLEIARRPGAGQ